ncbi:MAG: hypothetical protein ACREP2_13240, partial [Rhodanobacteraceae bacterium]
ILLMLACMVAGVLVVPGARAETTAQVVATWPSGDTVTLGRNQTFYLRVRYHSDAPTHLWATAYGDGGPLHVGTNSSRVYPAGDGDALVWFFFLQPGETVDGIRISAGDGSDARTHVVADYPVQVSGGDEPAAASGEPEWVGRLRQQDKAAQDAAYKQAMNAPTSVSDTFLIYGFIVAVLASIVFGFAMPAWCLWRWRGTWRMLAAVPAVVIGFVVLRIFFDTARDPTSHNLWPFEIVMWGGLGSVWMVVLGLVHRFSGAGRAPVNPP